MTVLDLLNITGDDVQIVQHCSHEQIMLIKNNRYIKYTLSEKIRNAEIISLYESVNHNGLTAVIIFDEEDNK